MKDGGQKKIALWGHGWYGKDMEQILSLFARETLLVTAILDRQYACPGGPDGISCSGSADGSPQSMPGGGRPNSEETPLYASGADAPALFRRGVFEAVLITVFDRAARAEIASSLKNDGIPVLSLSNRGLFAPAESFPGFHVQYALTQEGYRCQSIDGAYMALLPRSKVPYVFGEDGRICSALWQEYFFLTDPLTAEFCPHPIPACRELAGEWCLPVHIYGRNYWHFTYETLDKLLLMEEAGYQGKYLLPRTGFSESLSALLGIDSGRIVWLDDLDDRSVYRFGTLHLPVLSGDDRKKAAPVLLRVRDRILSRLGQGRSEAPAADEDGNAAPSPRRLFVRRIGSRKLLLPEDFARAQGLTSVVPEEITVEEQIRLFAGADIILSPHGANSSNALYMRKGAVLIETFPEGYLNPCCLETLRLAGVGYLPVTKDGVIGNGAPTDAELGAFPLSTAHMNEDYGIPSGILCEALRRAEAILL